MSGSTWSCPHLRLRLSPSTSRAREGAGLIGQQGGSKPTLGRGVTREGWGRNKGWSWPTEWGAHGWGGRSQGWRAHLGLVALATLRTRVGPLI